MKVNIPEIEKILHILKASTDTSLRAVQRSVVPHFYDLKLKRVTKYIYDEAKYRSKKLLYRVDNIDYIKDSHKAMMYDCNLLEAINKKYINPFILFMNGSMVDYSKIRIITDSRNTYLEISNNAKFDIYKRFRNNLNLNRQEHIFPPIPEILKDRIYLEVYPSSSVNDIFVNGVSSNNSSIINEDLINTDKPNEIVFTPTGEITSVRLVVKDDINIYDIKEFNEKCIVFPDYTTISKLKQGSKYPNMDTFLFEQNGNFIDSEEKYKLLGEPECTMISYNNLLKADIIIGKSDDNGLINLDRNEDYKNSIDCIFTFDEGILIDDIKDYGANVYKTYPNTSYKAYYYKEFKNVNNITRFTKMTDYLDHLLSGKDVSYIEPILDPMDFIFDQSKYKIDRIKEVVLKICKHNPNLLQEYIDSKSKVKTEYYERNELIDLSDKNDDSYVYKMIRVPHGRIHGIGVMVYIDGLLYDQDNVSYDENYVYITFNKNNLENCSYVEFMIFYDVFNDNIRVTYDKNDKEFLLANYIPYEDIQVLTHDIDNHIYKSIPITENLQYEIPNTLTDLGKGYINLDFPEYYDGRDLFLSSRRKFIYDKYVITDTEFMIEKLYKILLSDKFRYCTNNGQFMLFHNGRKISGRDAVICLNKWNLPFNKRFIHLNKKCEIGDIIDIFYVPEELSEVYFSETIEERGYVHINYDDLGYTLDGKNSSIFINGRRVPSHSIETVGNDHARINIDTTSRKNVSVVKHIYYDDLVFQTMREVESQWDKMIAGLSDEKLDELFDFDVLLTDTEEDVRSNLYPTYMVLYEIIRRYWIETGNKVNVENPLFYIEEHGEQKIIKIDSSIYTLSVPKMLDKYVNTDSITIDINGSKIVPLDANKPFINSNDIDNITITHYNPNSIVIPNDSNIFESDNENIIDIIEKTIIEKQDIYKFANDDHLKIDGTHEILNTIGLIDKYFYDNLKNHTIDGVNIYELDATRRFIEYKKLLETPEFQEYFKNYVTLIYVVDAAIEYLVNANLGPSGDIHVDANRIFPYYWDMRIAEVLSEEMNLVGVPFNSNLYSIVEIHNKVGV